MKRVQSNPITPHRLLQLTITEISQVTGKTLRPFMRPPANVSATCIHYYVTHTVSFTFVMETGQCHRAPMYVSQPLPAAAQWVSSQSEQTTRATNCWSRGWTWKEWIRGRKERECRCDRSPKVSSGQKMQLLLLERVFFFFVLICCSCWLPCLGEADGSSYYYQQDYQAPAYYQEGNYYPDYQEEYYRGGGGYYNQESWRRQDQAEEQDEESPIPVIIKGFSNISSMWF